MNLDDLWIGDLLVILKSGKEGTFQGIHREKAKARVQVGEKIILVSPQNLSLAPEKKYNKLEELGFDTPSSPSSLMQERLDFDSVIDLHMEKLQPSKKNDNPIAILEFQLRKLREFIDRAIELKLPKITVIHGKGTGALKMETFNILDSYSEKKSYHPINNEGGVIVYLAY